jgi:WD40 repeat protein
LVAVGYSIDDIRERQQTMWRRWRSTDGSAVLSGHQGPVLALAHGQLHDRPVVVSGGEDGEVRLWGLSDGRPLGVPLEGHEVAIRSLSWLYVQGEPRVLSLDTDGHVLMRDPRSSARIDMPAELRNGSLQAIATAGSRQNPALILATDDGLVSSWDPTSWTRDWQFWTGTDGTFDVTVVDKRGHEVVSVGEPRFRAEDRFQIIDNERPTTPAYVDLGIPSEVTHVACLSDDDQLIVAAAVSDGKVWMWDSAGRRPPRAVRLPAKVLAMRMWRSRNLPVVVCVTADHRWQVVSVASGDTIAVSPRTPSQIEALAVADLSSFEFEFGEFDIVLCTLADGTVTAWSLLGVCPVGFPWSGHTESVRAIEVCGVEGWPVTVSASIDGTVRLWDVAEYASEEHHGSRRAMFAEKLERLRVAHMGFTADLADRLNVSTSAYWSWIHGKSLPRRQETVEVLESLYIAAGAGLFRGELVHMWQAARRERKPPRAQPSRARGTGGTKDYDVFISYSSKDKDLVAQMAASLASKRIRVWWDVWEMKPGDILRERIGDGIARARYFVVLITRSSISSKWVQYELNSGMVQEIEERRVRVVPMLGPGATLDRLPADLRAKRVLDVRAEPKLKKAVEDLADLVPPELRAQREQVERRRQPAVDRAGIRERQELLRRSPQSLAFAALRGLAATPGPEALVAISGSLFTTRVRIRQIERSVDLLARRGHDGGLVPIVASLLFDYRICVHKLKTLRRFVDADASESPEVKQRIAESTDAAWHHFLQNPWASSQQLDICVDLVGALAGAAMPDLRNGAVLCRANPVGARIIADRMPTPEPQVVDEALLFIDERLPGLSDILLAIPEPRSGVV